MMQTLAGAGESAVMAGVDRPPTRRRWLHVVSHTDPRYGGLSSAVPALAASLQHKAGIQVSLAAFCLPGELHQPREMDAELVSFWPTSRKGWILDRSLQTNFMQVLQQADGVHIHGLWEESTAVACRLARRLGKPYVLSAHGMLEPWALNAKRLKKQIYAALIEKANVAGAACLHALTKAEASQYREFGARCPIAVIPNAVTLPKSTEADLFLSRFSRLRGKRLVLFLSRLHPKKGLDLLIESWAQVGKRYPNACLVIAGPDSECMEAQLLHQVQHRGMDAQVCFTGMLAGDMKWSALESAEIYVLPSYSEGLSMALLEAMGVGLPVIATYACNMPEVTSAAAGWEIEPKVDSLSRALGEALAHSPEENRARGRNGAQLIASRYTPEQVTGQFHELYDFLLGGPKPKTTQMLPGEAR